jgi:peptide/nickel transport system permease protein
MLKEGFQYMEQAPWLAFAPGAAIFLTVLAFNLVGDALQRALDPRLRRTLSASALPDCDHTAQPTVW